MRALLNGLAIASLLAFAGCGVESEKEMAFKDAPEANTPDHGHEGPNGGEVLEFTDDHSYHAEVCMDETSRDVMVFIYGASMDTPAPINADGIEFEIDKKDGEEVEVDAAAKPRDGEADGQSSVFTVAGSNIPEDAKDLHDFHWHMHIRIGDKEYEAEMDHSGHAHGDEDGHAHGEDGEHKHAEGDGHKHDEDGDEGHMEGGHKHEDGEEGHKHADGDEDHKHEDDDK